MKKLVAVLAAAMIGSVAFAQDTTVVRKESMGGSKVVVKKGSVGCKTKTVRKTNEMGDSKTVQKTKC
jgi:uncharacterized protein YdeI (BOF family)